MECYYNILQYNGTYCTCGKEHELVTHLMDVIDAVSVLSQLSLQPTEPPLQPVPDLLNDIIVSEILPKLPAKSLLRFKTVCKSFKTLISSPEFIRLHLRQSLSSDNSLLVSAATDRTLDIYDLDSLSSAPATPSATFRWPVYTIYAIGSCNGLLLITTSGYLGTLLPLVLLNPSTRSYINIDSTATVIHGNLGLGFDCHTNDYKIVSVSNMYDYMNGDIVHTIVTTVYSVNSKSWKRVDEILTSESMEEQSYGVLIDNHLLHWMDWSTYNRKCRISCFNVISEKWMDDVLLPENLYDPSQESYFLDFGVLDGCLFSSYVDQVNSHFDVWVMKEYGVHESWIKLFSINISDALNGGVDPIATLFLHTRMRKFSAVTSIRERGGVIPIAYRGRGTTEVLLRDRFKPKNFWWYNWKNNDINKADVPDFWGHQPCIFKGSLVRLPDAKLFGGEYEHDTFSKQHTHSNEVHLQT
ncbi:hypothetical protein RND81_13G006400 [Saponaria officinalis]|uniref:F-box domain-containing protein n=1 Tax=Saponaria officinalis TaxID=3572 RepID=A0AAW1GW16_SAPOF